MTNFLSLTMQCYIHLSSSETHNYSRNMTNIIHHLTFIYHKKIMQKIFCLLFCIFLSDKTVNPNYIIFICFIKVFIEHQPFLHNKQMIWNCVLTVWKDVSSAWKKLLFPFHNTQLILPFTILTKRKLSLLFAYENKFDIIFFLFSGNFDSFYKQIEHKVVAYVKISGKVNNN